MITIVERSQPRIAVNALAQYLIAPAGRRHRIIVEQKRPKTFQVNYYDPATDAICEFLAGQIGHEELLSHRRGVIGAPVTKEWGLRRNESCGEAIRAVANARPDSGLAGLVVKRAKRRPPKMVIGSVLVSVRPELFLVRKREDGRVERGYLKLYFSKNAPLTQQLGKYIAAIVHQYAEMRLAERGGCDRELCRVLDVFTGNAFIAPIAIKRNRADIAEACREIGAMWRHV